jgi:hypothetical protein
VILDFVFYSLAIMWIAYIFGRIRGWESAVKCLRGETR